MKLPLIVAAAFVAAFAGAQTFEYKVFIKGKPAGTVRSTFATVSGRYIEDSKGTISQNGQSVSLSTRTELDSSYDWRIKSLEATANGKTAKATAVPKGSGAHVTIQAGKQTVERDIPKPSKVTTVDATAAWFRTKTPKVGESYKYQRFDMQRMTWVEVTYKYIGPRSTKIGGKSRAGFAMERDELGKKSVLIVDNKAVPILLDSDDMRMERVYK